MASGQSGIMFGNPSHYGPCNTYLNIMEYKYSFNELRKDTLRYKASENKFAAVFVQNKSRLLSAELYDKKGNKVSIGNFKDGNGQLIINYSPDSRSVFTFKDGKINDSVIHIKQGRVTSYCIYQDNVPVKSMTTFLSTWTIANYDSLGVQHDSTLYYGFTKKAPLPCHSIYYDSYKGELRQASIYDHGELKEQIMYKKDGSVKSKDTYKVIPKNHAKKYHKSCL